MDTRKITLKLDIEDIFLEVEKAIPCGLIINELISNSLKHAFPDDREGEIGISIHSKDKDIIELIVRDNGVGLPKDLNIRETESLGLHLVVTLVKQLQGEMNVNRKKGTKFTINFPSTE